ncbi:MAG: hypothetical protein O3A46_03565 [Candidatus Poribacteria bacterium]|nr:hypothetical protein [Candidatus Poribacteria bacterium]
MRARNLAYFVAGCVSVVLCQVALQLASVAIADESTGGSDAVMRRLEVESLVVTGELQVVSPEGDASIRMFSDGKSAVVSLTSPEGRIDISDSESVDHAYINLIAGEENRDLVPSYLSGIYIKAQPHTSSIASRCWSPSDRTTSLRTEAHLWTNVDGSVFDISRKDGSARLQCGRGGSWLGIHTTNDMSTSSASIGTSTDRSASVVLANRKYGSPGDPEVEIIEGVELGRVGMTVDSDGGKVNVYEPVTGELRSQLGVDSSGTGNLRRWNADGEELP